MGSPEQDPRFLPPAGPAVRVSSVMAGQEWVDPNGETQLAAADCVLIELLEPDTRDPQAVLIQTADAAISLAHLINNAAVKLINAEVKDDGSKLSILERVNRINQRAKEANTK